MSYRCAAAFVVGLCFGVAPAAAQAQDRAIVQVDTPVMLEPGLSGRPPLRVAAKGSTLTLLKNEGAWAQVQFQDPQFGLRTGYVQTKDVRLDLAELRPLDLSVSPAPAPARLPTAAPASLPAATPPGAAARRGISMQTMTFRKVDYSEMVGEDERRRSARLVLDPVARTLTFADEDGGEAKAVYASVPYDVITKIVYERAAHRRYTAGVLVNPLLFLTKAKKHWLTLEVKGVPTLPQGFLYARLDKDNYRQVLSALRAGTGLTIEEHEEN